jgi:hypothetical protein
MLYMLMGYLHAAIEGRVRAIRSLAGERGQGTVEYVGLILLVSLLMVGMVAAMKGFNRWNSKTRKIIVQIGRLLGHWSEKRLNYTSTYSRTSCFSSNQPPSRNVPAGSEKEPTSVPSLSSRTKRKAHRGRADVSRRVALGQLSRMS